MDSMKQTWERLREQGRRIGAIYQQPGAGARVVIDDVAMSFLDATAVARGWITIDQVAVSRSNQT